MYINAERSIANFEKIRDEWIDILVANPSNSSAAQYIISINSKLSLLDQYRDFDKLEYAST